MYLYILISILAIVNIALVVVSHKIYKNAKTIESPDNIVNALNALSKEFQKLKKEASLSKAQNTKFIKEFIEGFDILFKENAQNNIQNAKSFQESVVETLTSKLTSINESTDSTKKQITSLREYASSQDEEINRHRNGYDLTIIKKFVVPMISAIDKLENSTLSDEDDLFEEILDRLLIALETHDVEKFEVPINTHRKDIPNLDQFSQIKANKVTDEELDGTIHSVLLQPYVYNYNSDIKPLRNGIISINKYVEDK